MAATGDLSNLIKLRLKNLDEGSILSVNEQIISLEKKLQTLKYKIEIPPEDLQFMNDSIKGLANKINKSEVEITLNKDNNRMTQQKTIQKGYSGEALLKAILKGIIFVSNLSTIRLIADGIEELNKTEKAIIKGFSLLAGAGFAPNKEVNRDFLKAINECESIENTSGQKNAIIGLTLEYYDIGRLNNIYSQWAQHPLIKKRMPILKSAITAHNQKDYVLSIPVLLAQIEGIIIDGFYHVGPYGHDRLNLYLKELIKTQRQTKYSFEKNIYTNLFNNVMMVSFVKGVKEYSKSRHSILHGASYRYGKADYSLKLILFLDMIIGMFNYCSYESQEEFHVVGCKLLKGRASKTSKRPFEENYFNKRSGTYIEKLISFYQSENEAIQAGKIHCPVCIKVIKD